MPAAARTEGKAVLVRGMTAVDRGLSPGSVYAYALFTEVRRRWTGPLTTFASTAPRDGATTATYVADPSTVIPAPGEVTGLEGTGSGLDVMLRPGVLPPVLGAAMVLPASTGLPGGYIGTVTTISADGSAVTLSPATLSDAFDYYKIDVPNIAASTAALDRDHPDRLARLKHHTETGCNSAVNYQGDVSAPVSFGGHYIATYSKHNILGVNVTTGASFDVAITASITPQLAISTSRELSCALTFASITKIIAEIPLGPLGILPIMVKGDMSIALGSSGELEASDIGGSAIGELWFKGSVNGPTPVPFTGGLTGSFTPLDATVTSTSSFSLKAGIALTVGPGVGDTDVGVIAGITGEFDPINASYSVITTSDDDPSQSQQQCVKLSAGGTAGLSLSAQAWLGHYATSASITAPSLNHSWQFAGSPWYVPQNCEFEITSTGELPQATQGSAYVASLEATGGPSPYTWAVTSGSLPAGLTLDPATGVISGTPTTAGTSTFQITATDADGATATKSFTLTVAGSLDHLVLSPASASIASGGSQSYTVEGYDAANDDLGPDTSATLSISPDGSCTAYTCTATTAGPHTVTATDGDATGTATLTVTSALSPCGTAGVYSSAGATATCTYTSDYYAGLTDTFTVPAGVGSLDVVAAGAEGGSEWASGGQGASVEDTAVPVAGGSVLSVVLDAGGGAGGENNGGALDGSDGGGYSGIFDPSDTPLVIAGGGGGGGDEPNIEGEDSGGGGQGDTGSGGGQGAASYSDAYQTGATGGGGGTSGGGGAGGSPGSVDGGTLGGNGTPGSSLTGGQGGAAPPAGESSGGGGGGGYYGGGGGGGGNYGAGGGGGSSYGVGPGLSNEQATSGLGSVTISWLIS